MSFVKLAAEIWRAYATDGEPTSGAHKPVKSDIRAHLLEVETQLAAVAAFTVLGGTSGIGFNQPFNLALSASVAANVLTVALKSAAGSDPSATDAVLIPFRSPTAATGTPVVRSVTAANSLVISAGSSLGASNSTAFRLWIVAFDDAGTIRLGAINARNGLNIYPLGAKQIASSTAEGGAGAADSAHVFYTGSAVSSKAFRILGYLEWSSGLATAGLYASAPTLVQLYGPGISLPGEVVQTQRTQTGTGTTGTTAMPADNTIPQNTEGDEYMTQAITPIAECNVLEVEALAFLAQSNVVAIGMGLFQDSTASALASAIKSNAAAGARNVIALAHRMVAATVSATTFKIRAGGSTGATTTFNGSAGTQDHGGTLTSFLQVKEIMA